MTPGQPIIYRYRPDGSWNYSIYNRPYNSNDDIHILIDRTQITDENILPYNDITQHLIGKYTDYIEYKPKPNTVIAVRDNEQDGWMYRLFLCIDDKNRYVCKMDGSSTDKRTYEWRYATSIEESLKD